MNSSSDCKYIKLPIAVLDGDDPRTWWPFGNKLFTDLMETANTWAKPYAVRQYLLERYKIEIDPMLIGPKTLEGQNYLDKIVGVIIDALPQDGEDEAKFYERKPMRLKDYTPSK